MDVGFVRAAFVVIKLNVNGVQALLCQSDSRWNDVNLVGGHENAKDRGRPEATARREVLEELSALRRGSAFRLDHLAGPISLGPKWSKSAKQERVYELNYFLLVFKKEPVELVDVLMRGRRNVLIPLAPTAEPSRMRSEIMRVLEERIAGGLASLEFSWPDDIGPLLRRHGVDTSVIDQPDLRFG